MAVYIIVMWDFVTLGTGREEAEVVVVVVVAEISGETVGGEMARLTTAFPCKEEE